MRMLLSDLAKASQGEIKNFDGSAKWCLALSTDTRTLKTGDVFLALRGENFDGHLFLEDAVKKGAQALILEKNYEEKWRASPLAEKIPTLIVESGLKALGDIAHFWRNQFKIPVVAITGSNGKTTTRAITTTLLSRHYRVHGTDGNLNNLIGMPQTLLGLSAHHEVVVLEMGMNHLGEIARLAEIARPTVGVITNVGPVHVEHLGSIENVAKAKGELFQHMDPKGIVAINVDDPYCSHLAEVAGIPLSRQISFGIQKSAQVKVERIEESPRLSSGNLVQKISIRDSRLDVPEVFDVDFPLPGVHNVYNLVAGVAVGLHLGLNIDEIQLAAKSIRPVGSRSKIVSLKHQIFILDDCYNANPVSMRASIDLFAQLKGTHPGLIVLGDMLELGDISDQAHQELGGYVASKKNEMFFTAGAQAERMAQGAVQAGMPKKQIKTFKPSEGHRPADATVLEMVSQVANFVRDRAPSWILVKASRGVALERVVAGLVNEFGLETKSEG